jgi:hypothetical protein
MAITKQSGLKMSRIKGCIGLIIFLVLLYSPGLAKTETRYYRGEQQTVNGRTAYKLGNSNSDVDFWYGGEKSPGGLSIVSYCSSVYIQHDDGTDTMIGKGVAFAMRNTAGQGYQSATWNCPEISLRPTDAIYIQDYIWDVFGSNIMGERYFITEQLGATKLNAATWTFTRWTYWDKDPSKNYCRIYHGGLQYNTRIDGFSYTPAPPPIVSPTVATQNADGISSIRAAIHGAVINASGVTVVERGFDWGLTANYGNSRTESGVFGNEAFSYMLSTLTPGATYHFRAKARNSAGWGYGADMVFTTIPYIDIGLMVYDGSRIIHIACEPEGILASPLRIRKNLTTYGIVLVDPSDSEASKITIRTNLGIKAFRKY